ncbi:extracellular solute-binding protein [Nonomuraea sp. NPDC050328]|uniref:extracellular solute-binding protein n=1 Tax=Nonomuraea sp. NPDC050328 TaxID=3364361 RepID=UPI00379B488E
MNKKFVGGAALALAAVLTLASCGSGSGSGTAPAGGGETKAAGGEPVTLSLVAAEYGDGPGAPNSSETFWKGISESFTKANPNIKVDVKVLSWTGIDDAVATLIQNGQVPDILQLGGYAGYVKEGLLYPIDDVMSPNVKSDILPSFAKLGEADGKMYGVPFISSARALFYNKELFEKAGIAEPPKTWDELKAAAEKLKAAGVSQPYGLPLGQEEAQAESFLWMMGNGGGYTDASGKWAINSAQNKEAFTFLKGLVDAGLTTPNPGTKNRKDVWADFAAGKIGMVNGGPMAMPGFDKGAVNGKYGVTVTPGKSGPLTTTLGVADWMMAFNKNGHKEEIKKFFDFFYGTPDASKKIIDTYKFTPVTQSAATALSSDEKLKPFLDVLPNATFYPFTDPKWEEVKTQTQQTIGNIVKDPNGTLDNLQKIADGS